MTKQIQINYQKEVELAAETLAKLLIQQITSKRNLDANQEIKNKDGKLSR